jgi:hypothetical protein
MSHIPLSDDEREACRLYPPSPLPDGLATTAQLVEGIRSRMARRQAAALRRARFLRVAAALAACAAIAVALGMWYLRGSGGAEYAESIPASAESVQLAQAEEEAFAAYEKEFGEDPCDEAFEALDTLISALECDFSDFDLQSI